MSLLPTNPGTSPTPTDPFKSVSNTLSPNAGKLLGSQSTLSEWAGPYVTDMLGKTKALSDSPYQVYGGPLTAGASSLQQQYFQGLGNIGFPGNFGGSFTNTNAPTLPSASLTGPTTPAQSTGIAANYMNPYLSAVLAPQLSDLQRQAQIAQVGNASKLSQAGAYGGSRQAIMDAELQRNLLDQSNRAIAAGYSSAYDAGRNQFNTEQEQGRGIANLLGTAGGLQRDIEAQGIAADKAEFEAQRDYPYKMLQFEQSMLQGLPIQSVAASYQQPSGLSNFVNTTGGLIGLYEKLFGGK
jgi:hypothetical protein